jgi:hypothetical protein
MTAGHLPFLTLRSPTLLSKLNRIIPLRTSRLNFAPFAFKAFAMHKAPKMMSSPPTPLNPSKPNKPNH